MSEQDDIVTMYHPDQGDADHPAGRAQTTMKALHEVWEPKGLVIDTKVARVYTNTGTSEIPIKAPPKNQEAAPEEVAPTEEPEA